MRPKARKGERKVERKARSQVGVERACRLRTVRRQKGLSGVEVGQG